MGTEMSRPDIIKWTGMMMRIRLFEERALQEFSRGTLFGTTHTCIGQEANAVGVIGALERDDIVFSNHRCHGHFLAHGGDMRRLAAELMGRATGVCGGVGGSQHLYWHSFYSNGIQGGIVPCATGMALAEKRKGSGRIVCVCLGDGTLGQGVIYESFNIASLWKLPVIYLVEHNRYAQSTPTELAVAGSIAGRFECFGIPTTELNTTDVTLIRSAADQVIQRVRNLSSPEALVVYTYRFSPHSKGDDTRCLEEIVHYRQFDPLTLMRCHLPPGEYEELQAEAGREVDAAYQAASQDPWPTIDDYHF